MNLRKSLVTFVKVVSDEAERNPAFRTEIEKALGLGPDAALSEGQKRKGGRRTPALVDPVEAARQGENFVRQKLSDLNIEELRDVVAQYGMDPGKLVMKWKDESRVVDRIVEIALARATKGDAFRRD